MCHLEFFDETALLLRPLLKYIYIPKELIIFFCINFFKDQQWNFVGAQYSVLYENVYYVSISRIPLSDWICLERQTSKWEKELYFKLLSWSQQTVPLKGNPVCREARITNNIKKKSFCHLNRQFKDGDSCWAWQKGKTMSDTKKTKECIGWLELFFSSIGDHRPHSKSIHLPSCFTKFDVHKKMIDENTEFGQQSVSMPHFLHSLGQVFESCSYPKRRYQLVHSSN